MKFRKKPVVIDAFHWDGQTFEMANLLNGAQVSFNSLEDGGPYLYIHTLEGIMRASPGDWVIRGVKGEYYPCKPDIFEATYEVAE